MKRFLKDFLPWFLAVVCGCLIYAFWNVSNEYTKLTEYSKELFDSYNELVAINEELLDVIADLEQQLLTIEDNSVPVVEYAIFREDDISGDIESAGSDASIIDNSDDNSSTAGTVIFYGTELGYDYDVVMPDGYTNFVLYSDSIFYVGNFDRLLLDDSGNYYIPQGTTIGRYFLTGDWSTEPWKQYSNRNIGTVAYYYNVPIYDYEEPDKLISVANYNQSDYENSGSTGENESESDIETESPSQEPTIPPTQVYYYADLESYLAANQSIALTYYETIVVSNLKIIVVCMALNVAMLFVVLLLVCRLHKR